jgi:hypothetical protein
VREWDGKSQRIMVLNQGFSWNGTTYRSLTEIAFAMTGTRWSGLWFPLHVACGKKLYNGFKSLQICITEDRRSLRYANLQCGLPPFALAMFLSGQEVLEREFDADDNLAACRTDFRGG